MKLARLLMILVAVLFLRGVLGATASATPVLACQVPHLQLRTDTFDAEPSFRNHNDFTNSLAKVDAIWPRLEGGYKDEIAIRELTDLQATLTALDSQGEVDLAVAQKLAAQAQDIIDCENSLP
jgi:hypothetical protein